MTDTVVKVVLVDDHELIRKGLVTSFDLDPGTEIVGEARSVAEALAMLTALAIYLRLWRDGRFPGAPRVIAGIVLTLVAAAVPASASATPAPDPVSDAAGVKASDPAAPSAAIRR